MAALFLLVSTFVALLSQTTNAEPAPPLTNIPYPFSPYSGICPGFGQYPPFYLWCSCNLASCFDVNTEAALETIAAQNRLRICDVQQWAAIIEGTMYGINDGYTVAMVDEIAQSVRYEMDSRDLVYNMDYPPFCNRLYSSTINPVLAKRSPQVMYPNMLAQSSISASAMESYYMDIMYMMRNAMPYLSPQLQNNLFQSIFTNTPNQYLSLADDVDDKLELNIRSMFSEMYDMTPYDPLLL